MLHPVPLTPLILAKTVRHSQSSLSGSEYLIPFAEAVERRAKGTSDMGSQSGPFWGVRRLLQAEQQTPDRISKAHAAIDMPSPTHLLPCSISLCLVAGALAQTLQDPYAIPNYVTLGSSSWPDQSVWGTLNSTLGGRLQALRPWAAVCYTEDPLYDTAKCLAVMSNYTNDHAVCVLVSHVVHISQSLR